MKKYWQQRLGFAVGIFFCSLLFAQPIIDEEQIRTTVERALLQEALYWNPFPLPYDIAQKSQHKDAIFLHKLWHYGLLDREEKMLAVGGTSARPQYEQQWHYAYKSGRSPYAQEGFYYGRAQLIKILSISPPVANKGVFYIKVKVQWAVANMQQWAFDKAFQQARTLRRSAESQQRPFERDMVLLFNPSDSRWEVWQEPEF